MHNGRARLLNSEGQIHFIRLRFFLALLLNFRIVHADCLMYQSRSRSEGVQKLHIADPSEIWCMRNHVDSLFVDPTVCP
jgi:hypothetical protein